MRARLCRERVLESGRRVPRGPPGPEHHSTHAEGPDAPRAFRPATAGPQRGWCTEVAMGITLTQTTLLRTYVLPGEFSSHTDREGRSLPANLAAGCRVVGGGRGRDVGGSWLPWPRTWPGLLGQHDLEGALPLPQVRGSPQLPGTDPLGGGSAEGACWARPGPWSRGSAVHPCTCS